LANDFQLSSDIISSQDRQHFAQCPLGVPLSSPNGAPPLSSLACRRIPPGIRYDSPITRRAGFHGLARGGMRTRPKGVKQSLSSRSATGLPVGIYACKACSPSCHRGRTNIELSGNSVRSHTCSGHHDDPGAKRQPLLRGRGAHPGFESGFLFGSQCYWCGLVTHAHILPYYAN